MILRDAVLLLGLVVAGSATATSSAPTWGCASNGGYFAVMVEGAWSQARWDSTRDDIVSIGISLATLWGKAKQ